MRDVKITRSQRLRSALGTCKNTPKTRRHLRPPPTHTHVTEKRPSGVVSANRCLCPGDLGNASGRCTGCVGSVSRGKWILRRARTHAQTHERRRRRQPRASLMQKKMKKPAEVEAAELALPSRTSTNRPVRADGADRYVLSLIGEEGKESFDHSLVNR